MSTTDKPETPESPAAVRFLKAFLENPREVASVLPSSSALLQRLSALACLEHAQSVVELGPGTGGTTLALLEGMSPSARLLGIEVVPELVDHAKRIDDPRLLVVQGHAIDLQDILRQHNFPPPDVVVSGIPFSTMTPEVGGRLVAAIHASLAPDGTFVAYQFRDHICELANNYFGLPRRSFVPWNIPPLDLYEWSKSTSPAALQDQEDAGS